MSEQARKITITTEDMTEALALWLQTKMLREPVTVTGFWTNDLPGSGKVSGSGTFDVTFVRVREELEGLGEKGCADGKMSHLYMEH